MAKFLWKPTNQTGPYDEKRVETLRPVRQAVEDLRLPINHKRKLLGIINAVEMQIEDGGDHPDVNTRLLEALKLAVVHIAAKERTAAVFKAIDTFARTEEKRWEQLRAGTLPPEQVDPLKKLDDLIFVGYDSIRFQQVAIGCDAWLDAWELVKKLATPAMRTIEAFERAYPGLSQSVIEWSQDMEMQLHNAGLSETVYFEHRIRYAREYLAQFPDTDADTQVEFRRAEGEALWELGRTAEAEAVYQAVVTAYPDHAWGYIGWSDHYYMRPSAPGDYKRAEEILQQALARPNLDDRPSVEDRLAGLDEESQDHPRPAAAPATQVQERKKKPKKPKPKPRSGRKKRRR